MPRVEWLGSDVEHTPPSSADVKNEWICTSTLAICLYGMDKDSLPFSFHPHFSDAEVENKLSYSLNSVILQNQEVLDSSVPNSGERFNSSLPPPH